MKAKLREILKMLVDWLIVTGFLLMAWMIISWIDIVAHNLDPQPVYQAWNLFAILF